MNSADALERAAGELNASPQGASVTLTFSGKEFFFQGHFPGDPVLPAAVQIDAAVHFASRALGCKLRITEVTRAKFMHPAGPNQPLLLELEFRQEEDGHRVKAIIRHGPQTIAEIILRVRAEQESDQP